MLIIDQVAQPRETHSFEPEGTGHLVLQALSLKARERVRDGVEQLTLDIAAAHNPLLVDLEAEDPQAVLAEVLPEALPAWTAAKTLLSGTWHSHADRLRVRAALACPTGEKERCIPAFKPTGVDDVERRALALAWPVAKAMLVQATQEPAGHVAARLRQALGKRGSHLALVLTRDELARARDARGDAALRELAAEACAMLGKAQRKVPPLLQALSQPAPASPLLPWLSLRANELLVVPRLGSLARLPAFTAEVSQLLQPDHAPAWASVLRAPLPAR